MNGDAGRSPVIATASSTRWYNRPLMWCLLFVILCATTAVLAEHIQNEGGDVLPESVANASTFNNKSSGASGLFEIASRTGLDARRWQVSYRDLRDVKGTLVILGPLKAFSETDCRHLQHWVQQGNSLVYLDNFSILSGSHLLTRLGFTASKQPTILDEKVQPATIPEAAYVNNGLIVSSDSRVSGGTAVASDKQGAFLAQCKTGAGRVLVGTVGSFCANHRLSEQAHWGNFQFLINWLKASPGPIYFDERSHGHSSVPNMFIYLASTPAGPIAVQLFLLLSVAVVSASQRFGQCQSATVPRRISNFEFVDGFADVLSRAKAGDTAWTMLFVPFRARLCRKLSVAPDADPETLGRAWADFSGQAPAACTSFLAEGTKALDRRHLSPVELVALVARLDELSGGAAAVK